MRGTDRDRAIRIAWIVDAVRDADPRRSRDGGGVAIARVAGGSDDDNSGLHQAIHFRAQRALPARKHLGVELISHAEIHTMDARQFGIGVHLLANVGQRLDHIARASAAIRLQYAQADELALRNHAAKFHWIAVARLQSHGVRLISGWRIDALESLCFGRRLSRNDSGDVGAVTARVRQRRGDVRLRYIGRAAFGLGEVTMQLSPPQGDAAGVSRDRPPIRSGDGPRVRRSRSRPARCSDRSLHMSGSRHRP